MCVGTVLPMHPSTALRAAALLATAAVLAACGSPAPPSGTVSALPVAAPAHTVVVIMENHAYGQVIGSGDAPYINALARQGALFTASYALTHPSEPNYLALFSGSTQGVSDDSCPHQFTTPNLGSELIAAHLSFAGYSEGLPARGSYTCSAGNYARRHVPWINFQNVPAAASMPFSSFPAGAYATLPTVSFVIPDLCHDMHNCSVGVGDTWLRDHIAGYAAWAMTHDSLLILTWDENDDSPGNHVATIFAGQMVRPGSYGMPITHYSVLRTIEVLYHLQPSASAGSAATISGIWK
jgi:hypothetical protein